MKKRLTSVSAAVLSLVATSCYNNPQTSLKHPGEGPANVHARPAVGPGTVSGGSTAGPQPAAHTAHGQQQTQPQPSGATQHGAPEAGVHGSPRPVQEAHGAAQQTQSAPARTGNEKGGDRRGPEAHAEGKH